MCKIKLQSSCKQNVILLTSKYLKRSNFREFRELWSISGKLIPVQVLVKTYSQKLSLVKNNKYQNFQTFFKLMSKKNIQKAPFCMHNVSFAIQNSNNSTAKLYRPTKDYSQNILSKRSQL